MIHLTGDYTFIDREVDRLESLPNAKARKALNLVLEHGFQETQKAVHVETGSLKKSGRTREDVSKIQHRWEGQIIYGGRSTGSVNNPVNYAIYEKRRGVGGAGGASNAKGDHDFMRPLEALDPLYIGAIKAAMRG